MSEETVTRWKQGDPLLHGRLNETVDAINRQPFRRMRRGDSAGQQPRYARIAAVTATSVVDGNAEPAQWIPTVHEGYFTAAGYGTPASQVFTVFNEGVGYRGPAYYLSLMEMDGSEVPADVKLVAPEVDDIVRFFTVEIANVDGTVTIQAIIETPLSAECA